MNTKILSAADDASYRICADIIRGGGLCAFPTETVYGLGANGLCSDAVDKIFVAKGRPQDNPLILHVADFSDALRLWRDVPDTTYRLAEVFWPGALTIICKKSDIIPDNVCAHLDTVAVRCPSDVCAHRLIAECGVPVAAPSANLSGKPSPTEAQHVIDDMTGRIDAVLCGGKCAYGVESTVISLVDKPIIYRPGIVTPEEICAVIGETEIADSVLMPLGRDKSAPSPGMKYKHYSPDADVTAFSGDTDEQTKKIIARYDAHPDKNIVIFASAETAQVYGARNIAVIGERKNPFTMCGGLFSALRTYNDCDMILCETIDAKEAGLAYMNRLLRACGFKVI